MISKATVKLLKEPSTYAGLAGLAALLGVNSEEYQVLAHSIAGIFSFMAIFMQEGQA